MASRKRIKKCHYDVLGLEMTASDEEIRRSYKLLALKYHPDKNMDDLSAATETFREVQAAYEILSNPQERCWYDKHREVILSGADKDSIEDTCFDVFGFFTLSCFSGYSDLENGFYSVYRNVFNKIVKEDTPYYQDSSERPPSFGYSYSSYADVKLFYSFWESYSTPKTFSFLDKYDVIEAPNRRIVRLMEKENKKLRDAAKKKRNEEIRALVAFVRRRDKRVEAQKIAMEQEREEKRKKTAEHRKKQLEARSKEVSEAKSSAWVLMDDMEQELAEIEREIAQNESHSKKKKSKNKLEAEEPKKQEGSELVTKESEAVSYVKEDVNLDDSSSSLESDDFYCVACDKLFKSLKSFTNHENSKKHKSNVASLRHILENEEKILKEEDVIVSADQPQTI